MFAISATFAPAIGPAIGGYLTTPTAGSTFFTSNLVPGAIMLATLWPCLRPAPMRFGLLRQGDWPGIATLAIGLASLQTVLEEGNKDDWFGSPFIVRLSLIATVSLALFLWIELTSHNPLLNLRLHTRRNFGLGSLANVLPGMALDGSVYLLPV
jgi:DHA2 family multidrug resistance protein